MAANSLSSYADHLYNTSLNQVMRLSNNLLDYVVCFASRFSLEHVLFFCGRVQAVTFFLNMEPHALYLSINTVDVRLNQVHKCMSTHMCF